VHFKANAIILNIHSTDKKETYVTAYTREFGKFTYLVRGLVKNEAKLKTALMPFSLSEIIAVSSRATPVITRATLIKDLYPKADFRNQSLAFYFSNLIDRLTEERLRDERIFSLISGALSVLKNSENTEYLRCLILAYLPLKLLGYLGYLPELGICTNCSKGLIGTSFSLSYSVGGLLCGSCRINDKKAPTISLGQLQLLRAIAKSSFKQIAQLKKISISQLKELVEFINFYTLYVTDIKSQPYKALKIINYSPLICPL